RVSSPEKSGFDNALRHLRSRAFPTIESDAIRETPRIPLERQSTGEKPEGRKRISICVHPVSTWLISHRRCGSRKGKVPHRSKERRKCWFCLHPYCATASRTSGRRRRRGSHYCARVFFAEGCGGSETLLSAHLSFRKYK